MPFARLLVRATLGLLFVGHGTQKLFGWFGGGGPEETAQSFEAMGLRPGRRHAMAAGVAETAGGALFAAGLATPLGTAALSSVMITAIRKVHWQRGVWISAGGFEYNAVILAVLFGLTQVGPGPLSLDAALGIERSGFRWALAALGAGAIGSAVAVATAGGDTPSEQKEEETEAVRPTA
jgi:putative oxidoreductase